MLGYMPTSFSWDLYIWFLRPTHHLFNYQFQCRVSSCPFLLIGTHVFEHMFCAHSLLWAFYFTSHFIFIYAYNHGLAACLYCNTFYVVAFIVLPWFHFCVCLFSERPLSQFCATTTDNVFTVWQISYCPHYKCQIWLLTIMEADTVPGWVVTYVLPVPPSRRSHCTWSSPQEEQPHMALNFRQLEHPDCKHFLALGSPRIYLNFSFPPHLLHGMGKTKTSH